MQNYSAHSRISFYVVACSLLLLPFVKFFTLGFRGLAEPANTFIYIPICVLLLLSCKHVFTEKVKINDFIAPLFLVTLLLIAYVLIKTDLNLTNNMVIYLSCILFFLLVIQNFVWLAPDKSLLITLLFVFGCCQLCFGLVEYFYNLYNQSEVAGSGRPEASFRQVNIMATMMLTNYLLAFYIVSKKAWFRKLFYPALIVTLLTPLVLFLCQSKASFVSIITLLALFALLTNHRFLIKNKLFLITTLLGVLIVFIYAFIAPPPRDLNEMTNISARSTYYLHSLNMILEKPLFGWGPGHFGTAFYYTLIEQISLGKYDIEFNSLVLHPHNEIFLWAIELGAIGIGYIGLFTYLLVKQLTHNFKFQLSKCWGLILATPIVVHSMFEFPIHTSGYVSFYLCIIVYCFSTFRVYSVPTSREATASKVIGVVQLAYIPLIVLIFLSAVAAAKYTSTENINLALQTREDIIFEFPTDIYIKQTDVLIDLQLALIENDKASIKTANDKIYDMLIDFPVPKIAYMYLENCEKRVVCEEDKFEFIKLSFPLPKNYHNNKLEEK